MHRPDSLGGASTARYRIRTGGRYWPVATSFVLLSLAVIGMVAAAIAFSWLVWLWALIPFGFVAVVFAGVALTDATTMVVIGFLVLGFVPGIVFGEAIHGSVLSLRGIVVQASVTAVSDHSSRPGVVYQFRLAAPDGRILPGGTYDIPGDRAVGPRYRVGDSVTVVYDPHGDVAPDAPANVHPETGSFVFGGVVVALLFGYFGWLHVRERRRSRL